MTKVRKTNALVRQPVVIRGVEYGSHYEAAAALGVTVDAVSTAVKKGRVDIVGLGSRKQVKIRGVVYNSTIEAALELGISTTTIQNAKNYGTLDRVGLRRRTANPIAGKQRAKGNADKNVKMTKPVAIRNKGGKAGIPVVIKGVEYPSMKAAAEILGVHRQTIKFAMKRGTLNFIGLKRHGLRKPVTIRGIEYPSIDAAASVLGVHRTTISVAIKNGTLSTVGKLVMIRGVEYRSFSDASRTLGVTPSTVALAAREGRIDGVGLRVPEPIKIRGIVYSSAAEAARQLGIVPSAIYNAKKLGNLDAVGLRNRGNVGQSTIDGPPVAAQEAREPVPAIRMMEVTVRIVSAYISNNPVPTSQQPYLIAAVNEAVRNLWLQPNQSGTETLHQSKTDDPASD